MTLYAMSSTFWNIERLIEYDDLILMVLTSITIRYTVTFVLKKSFEKIIEKSLSLLINKKPSLGLE